MPPAYDPVERIVHFGYAPETRENDDEEEETVYVGYAVPVRALDYGHIKSEIIEHVYPPKEEFALLNNAVAALLKERAMIVEDSIQEDIDEFLAFEEWREMAGNAAEQVMDMFS